MKKTLCWIGLFLIAYILQTSFLNLFSFKNINVDLILLLTVSYSLTHGSRKGAFVGFCGGLLQDIASGTFLGFNTFSKMIIGFIFGFMLGRVYEKKILLLNFCDTSQFGLDVCRKSAYSMGGYQLQF